MFEGKKILDVLNMGGGIFYVLLMASIVSIATICFKLVEFWVKSKITRVQFTSKIVKKIREGELNKVIDFCDSINSPMAQVAKAGIVIFKKNTGNFVESMKREILIQTVRLERFTTILGTLGSVAVYIGLFGTVMGIVRAFHDISKMNSGGISVVIGGVSEALIATAAGLFVSIPAVVAFNFFAKIIDNFIVDMECCCSVVEDALKWKKFNEIK